MSSMENAEKCDEKLTGGYNQPAFPVDSSEKEWPLDCMTFQTNFERIRL